MGDGRDTSEVGIFEDLFANDSADDELFSEYYEGCLSDNAATNFSKRLKKDPTFAQAYAEFESVRTLLSSMHKVHAPPGFDKKVGETIHRRSGGRFFGHQAWRSAIVFELFAIVVLVVAGIVYWVGRNSPTGGHKLHGDKIPELESESE